MDDSNTTVRVDCVCGNQKLPPSQITVYVCTNDASKTTYAFTCPECGINHRKSLTPPSIITLLCEAGCRIQEWADIIENHAGGPTFTDDDLIDFALWLQDWDGVVDLAV